MLPVLGIPEDADERGRVVEHASGAELHPVDTRDVTVDEAGVVAGVGMEESAGGQRLGGAGVGQGGWGLGGRHVMRVVVDAGEQRLVPDLLLWTLLQPSVAPQVTVDEPVGGRDGGQNTR